MVAPPGSIIQELIPALAAALGQVRRSPGRSAAWVEEVVRTLERDRPDRHERMRRRIGFARRLGDLAGLGPEEQAALTLGVFFYELNADDTARAVRPSRVWTEYLLRNESWLASCFQVCHAIASPGWEDIHGRTAAVAKVAVLFDTETLEHHGRPFQVIDSIAAEARESSAAPLIPILWSEDGQELCDHHFRRRAKGYKLEGSMLRRCLELLDRTAPRPTGEVTVAPLRLSGSAFRRADRSEPALPAPKHEQETAPSTAFDRRRQALRSRSRFGEAPHGPQDESSASRLPRGDGNADKIEQAPAAEREGEMENIRSVPFAPAPRRETLDMVERLQELRLQLGQIQRIATDAEQLLVGLAPQLDELASWIADMEAVVERWKGRAEADERAA